ncbi:LSM domain-containing protein [Colletotrichum graminicola]|nr:LSM domain-containing protein [Colletotrichum graminicola]
MSNKQGKMSSQINYRMRVTLNDGRQMTGQMLAFDKHMNLVLADTEEFRRVKVRQNKPAAPGAGSSSGQTIEKEEKRTLGLTIVRGAHIVSLSVESEPPADPSARLGKSAPGGIASTLTAGPGVARPAGRGAAPAPPSLAVSAPLNPLHGDTAADIGCRVLLPVLEVPSLPDSLAASPVPRLSADVELLPQASPAGSRPRASRRTPPSSLQASTPALPVDHLASTLPPADRLRTEMSIPRMLYSRRLVHGYHWRLGMNVKITKIRAEQACC